MEARVRFERVPSRTLPLTAVTAVVLALSVGVAAAAAPAGTPRAQPGTAKSLPEPDPLVRDLIGFRVR
jgi:hypothetical protein